jgi:subtilase family serine protease
MKQRLRSRRGALALAVIAAGTAFALLTATSSSHATNAARHAVSPAIGFGGQPEISGPVAKPPHPGDLFHCQSRPLSGAQGPRCYVPQQIQQAYGYSGLLASGVDGSGKTIVIVDAYSNPYIPTDLSIQDATFGLPPASYTAVAPYGVPAFDINDPNQAGWAEEITLDVLWAHAMAPGANIELVEATSNDDADILAALQWAVDNNVGDVISQSFGEAESCTGLPGPSLNAAYHAVYQEAVDKGMTVFASSGDSGAAQFNCDGTAAILSASSPASDPLVTGVGGTTLNASNSKGVYGSETAWTEPLFGCNPPALDYPFDVNCSGGGYSTIYSRPSYQNGFVSNAGRGVPDVAYNAGVNGGVITHCAVCNLTIGYGPSDPIFFLFGGTSAGSPQWAALTADADQMAGSDLGNINPQLYSLSSKPGPGPFHDVVKGNNDVAEIGAGYNASPGWDPVTGLGSPNAATLLPALAGLGGPPGHPNH